MPPAPPAAVPPKADPIAAQSTADKERQEKERLEREREQQVSDAARAKVVALLVGLDITPRTIDTLLREEFTSAAALSHATTEELKQLGIAAGQALLLKSKFKEGTVSGVGATGGQPAVTVVS